jgi:hypothetical protein
MQLSTSIEQMSCRLKADNRQMAADEYRYLADSMQILCRYRADDAVILQMVCRWGADDLQRDT